MRHKFKRYRPISTDLLAPPYMSMAILLHYLLRQEFPPLYITQNLQLAQLRFRLHYSPIQHFLWQLWQPLLQVVPLNTLETRMQTAVCHVDMAP